MIFDLFSQPIFLTSLFAILVMHTYMITFWNNLVPRQFHDVYSGVQKIHDGFTPRLGGLIVIIYLFFTAFFLEDVGLGMLRDILISLTPVIIVTTLEDIFNNIQPLVRLVTILLSSVLLLIAHNFTWPLINIPYLMNFFLDYPILLAITMVLSLTTLANGFNLIDGVNGLFYLSASTILGSLMILSNELQDPIIFMTCLVVLMGLLFSMPFNFPFGKMFAGDLGAYSVGIVVGFVTIVFFGNHPELPTWFVLLILFHPVFELFFTMGRRFIQKKSMTQADGEHLHQLMYRHIRTTQKFSTLLANNMTTMYLSPLYAFALLWIWWHGAYMGFFLIVLGCVIQVTLYMIIYSFLKQPHNHT